MPVAADGREAALAQPREAGVTRHGVSLGLPSYASLGTVGATVGAAPAAAATGRLRKSKELEVVVSALDGVDMGDLGDEIERSAQRVRKLSREHPSAGIMPTPHATLLSHQSLAAAIERQRRNSGEQPNASERWRSATEPASGASSARAADSTSPRAADGGFVNGGYRRPSGSTTADGHVVHDL